MGISNLKSMKTIVLLLGLYISVLVVIQTHWWLPWYQIKKLFRSTLVIDKSCNGTVFPATINNESNWGPVDMKRTIFITSAYYVKSRNRVFVIGAKPFHRVSVICQLWFANSDKIQFLQQSEAEVVAPAGTTDHYMYTSTIFSCQINSTESPTHVSFVSNSCDNPLNLLQVRDVSTPEKYERRFTVCMAPLFNFNNALRLVEWIELNRILGAEKFLLYNYSTSVNADNVIRHYLKSGLIEVIQWWFPRNIEFFAQKAALNDCLFRNKHVSEFITNVDTDEFIIPHGKDVVNWAQMIAQFDPNYAGYLVRHTFFRTDWKNKLNITGTNETSKLVTLTHFEHENRIYSANDRSKYFARTAYVEFANVHEIPRGRILTVPVETGLVHHYRKFMDRKCYKRVKDLIVRQKYGAHLTRNVHDTWHDIETENAS